MNTEYKPRRLFTSEEESDVSANPQATPLKASDFVAKRKREEIEEGEMLRFTKKQKEEREERERVERENWERLQREYQRRREEQEKREQEELKRTLREFEKNNNNNNEEEEEERIAFDPRITLEEIEREKLKAWERAGKALLELRRLEKIEAEIKRRKVNQIKEILGCKQIENDSAKFIGG